MSVIVYILIGFVSFLIGFAQFFIVEKIKRDREEAQRMSKIMQKTIQSHSVKDDPKDDHNYSDFHGYFDPETYRFTQ